ncbi:MAG: ribosomal protein S18-alanine N-acetyltransferase, partial [Aquificae bacterium]|nr:ribosomal protein S18-alanine N-acetyltransferase [Aquificota bacterium]
EINRRSFTTDAWGIHSFEKEFENRFSERFVLESDGKVVGYVILWVVGDEATVMSFALDEDFRGKGLGRFLLSSAIRELRGRVRRVILDVRKTNVRAINLYRSLGFRVVREREGYYSDGENALLMELELP